MESLWMFVGALAVVCLVPGPDMVLLLQTAATQGRSRGLATAVGLGLARGAHVALAAVGLAALLRTAPWAFDIVRMVGAAYLIWLGIKIWLTPSRMSDGASVATASSPALWRAALWRGLLTNITNPKALLFCSVLLPQFIQPGSGDVALQFLLLGCVVVGIGLLFDIVYIYAGATLGRWIRKHPIMLVIQRWTFASVLIGFGAQLTLMDRPR